MTAYAFYYRVAAQFAVYNNAFILPVFDGGKLTAIYPINAQCVDLVENMSGMYARLVFATGNAYAVPYEHLVHLWRHYLDNDIFGFAPIFGEEGARRVQMEKEREYRALQDFALVPRESETDTYCVRGTAVVFDTPACLYEIDGVKYYEVIDRKAFDNCDLSDVIMNYNHGGKVVARLKNKTLSLHITECGLELEADLSGTAAGGNPRPHDGCSGVLRWVAFFVVWYCGRLVFCSRGLRFLCLCARRGLRRAAFCSGGRCISQKNRPASQRACFFILHLT